MAYESHYSPHGEILNTIRPVVGAPSGDDDYLPIGESLIDYDDDCEVDA